MNKKHELAKKEDTHNQLPAVANFDYGEFEGAGFDSHTQEDYAVPLLGVLQNGSPLVESTTARPGQLVNTVTQETFDGKVGLAFIPVDTEHLIMEWKPRDAGGGIVERHLPSSEYIQKVRQEQEFGKWKSAKGNDLIETFYVYGICLHPDGSSEQMIIPFTSTKIKTYKRWMSKARGIQIVLPDGSRRTPPLFAHRYRITTINQKNSKGSWYNFDSIQFDGKDEEGKPCAAACRLPISDPLFQEAATFFKLIREGNIKAAFDTQNVVGPTTEAENSGVDADIPFE